MPYIIDGHNLIPQIPGLSLSDPDDEMALIEILQRFANKKRTRIELYFDQAPATRAGTKSHGLVRVHYIRKNSTADQAIKTRITQLEKEAKNWTVVSSDREIIAEAKSQLCKVISSDQFSKQVIGQGVAPESQEEEGEKPQVTSEEVDYWLDQFSQE
jgi:predicted RNA-binding protein with PIN domain